jgi:DNA-binding CsgD family transcriptional regulator
MFLKQNSTVAEGIMYCVGIGYALTIYYLLMHPKTVFYLNENNIDKKVIQLLLQGNKNKEIAYKIGITQNAVTKRLENMRKRNNCGNNEQLIFNLIKEREIVLK